MPYWNKEKECYEEEDTEAISAAALEERFRVRLLNELTEIGDAVRALEIWGRP